MRGRWKEPCSTIKKVNNQNRAYYTICRKEFGIEHCEGEVKALTLRISQIQRKASTSKS